MRFGSLFAGIGGLDLGLERAGMECAWQVEIDEYATRVLEKHWPNVRRWRDITTFPPDTIWTECEPGSGRRGVRQGDSEFAVDLVCGGFPCQDISFAGKGAGLSGERSGLFWEAIRVVGLLKPRYVLLENVAALLSRGLPDVLGSLASFGFDAEWHCIPAAHFGAPHIRDRVFIIGIRGGDSYGDHDSEVSTGSAQDSIAKGIGRVSAQIQGKLSDTESERLGEGRARGAAAPSKVRDTTSGLLSGDFRRDREEMLLAGSSWWATEPDVGRVAHGVSARMDRLRGLGNAVVPQVAEWIGRRIMRLESPGKD